MTEIAPAPPPVATRLLATDARRWCQLALATIWLFAGLLQAQSFMFTKSFATTELAPAADGNPAWVAASIHWAAGLVAAQPVAWNTAFALIQVALGLGIAFRPALRAALGASIAWSLVVWWFGEGLGGLLTGGATALGGAPGAVILYAVLAVLLWPVRADRLARFVAERPVGPVAARVVWIVLWGGLAALNLQRSSLEPGAVHATVEGMGDGQPGWVTHAVDGFAGLSRGTGTALTVMGTIVLAAVAVGVLLAPALQRAAVVLALASAVFIWLLGEGLGAPFGGQSTDPNSGPLLALVAMTYWPLRIGGGEAPR